MNYKIAFADYSSIFCRLFYSLASRCTLLTFILATFPASAHSAVKHHRVVIPYDLEVQLVPSRSELIAQATLQQPSSLSDRPLILVPGARITSVTRNGRDVPYSFHDGVLQLSATGISATETTVRIDYRATFNDRPPPSTIGIEDPSFGVSATIGPHGSFLSAGVPWFPRVDGVRGRYRVRVSVGDGQTAVTAGRLLALTTDGGTTTSSWQSDTPLEGLALAAGRYQVARDDLDGIQLLTFLSADNADLAAVYLAAIRRHLSFYGELIGPYPFEKFAVVENFLPTGFGLPSWTLLGKGVIRLPFIPETSLPHEIVHSWWGNAVEVDYATGNWSEGLATYLADYLLNEAVRPQEALEYRRRILRDYATLVSADKDFPLRDFRGRMAKYQQAIGYGKGAMVFHMLRREVGDDSFRRTLRRMAAEGNGETMGWREIETIFTATAGRDLGWFFRQWLDQPGAPRLTLDEVHSVLTRDGWLVSGIISQQGGPWRLPLPLRLELADGSTVTTTVAVSGRRTPFQLTTTTAPVRLAADPDSQLFRRLSAVEVPATVNDLLVARQPLVIVATGQLGLVDAARDLFTGLHWEDVDVVGEEDVDPAQLAGRDLLLLGWPQRTALHPPLPAGLSFVNTASSYTWQGKRGDALFAVLTSHGEQPAVTALLLADSAAAARRVVTKIPHYGRYSLLLFDQGNNLVKTTWEATDSPLTVVFPKE